MKISPVAQGSGTPGQSLGSVEVGRSTNPLKMERARAIARGEVPKDASDPQSDRIQQDVRRIKMRTQRSTNREEPLEEPAETAQSSTGDNTEQGTVEATQPLSPQFAALAKQKRALQVKERELLEREKALTANPQGSGNEELIARIKSKPLSVLQEHGVTYDQLTEAILSGSDGINPEIQALKDELKALKGDVEKTFLSKEEQAEEGALTEMLYEAEGLAKEGDAFEMIREGGEAAYAKVLRHIHSTYKKTGRVLDVWAAMETVENGLLVDAEKFARIKKVQSRIAPPPIEPLQPQQRSMRTLTARDSAAPALSARARALAAFHGTLKK